MFAEIHNYIRNPGDGGRLWNWIDPGLGLHMANLNQGTESLELGLGGNLSFGNGIISGGVGYNLSVKETYVFIGSDLSAVLNPVLTH